MKSIKKYALQTLAALTLAVTSVTAMATTITFDEITPAPLGELISNGYQGLDWQNFGVVRSADLPGTGYDYGMISGPNVGLNWSAQTASFSSVSAFSLQSFYLTRAWNAGTTRVNGYNGATLLYSVDIYATTTAPVFFAFNWDNLTKVSISDQSGGSQTAIDNITINAVPEPETYAMLLAGLGILGFAARRKRTAA